MNQNKHGKLELMTVGQLAKKMDITVKTLQYYDKKDVRRLYSNKDMVKLHQITSMKYLGFSLDTPE